MAADGYLNFDTKIDTDGFEGGIKSIDSSVAKLTGGMKKLADVVTAAFSATAIIRFGKESLEAAADVKAAASQMSQTFGEFENEASAAISRVAENADILDTRLNGVATSIYAFAKTSGMDSKTALSMMEEALTVAADSAAYYDRSLEDVSQTLRSFLKGNYENDAALGLSATETTRNAKAMELYGKKFADLSESQKQLALLDMVKDANRLSGAMGRAAREADGWANVTGNLREAWRQLLGVVGQPILKLAVPVVQQMTAALTRMTEAANAAWQALSRVFGWQEMQSDAINSAVSAQDDLTAAVQATEDAQEGALASFDDIEILASSAAESMQETGAAGATEALPETSVIPEIVDESQTERVNNLTIAFQNLEIALQPVQLGLQNLWNSLTPLQTFNSQALSDFYNLFLIPVSSWTMGDGLPQFINTITNGFNAVNWENLNTSLAGLFTVLAPFTINIGEGLLWLFENVFVPFGTWTMNDAAPTFIGMLTEAIELFSLMYAVAQPGLEWIWTNWLQPLAEWTGGQVIQILKDFTETFEDMQAVVSGDMSITEMIENMSDAEIIIGSVITAIGLVAAALVAYNVVAGIAAVVTGAIASPVVLVVAAIAGLIAIIVLCIKYWDEIKATAIAAWEYIVAAVVGSAETFYANVIEPIGRFFKELWENVKTWAINAWNGVVDMFKGAAAWFNSKVIQPIGAFFTSLWDGIKIGFIKLINKIIDGINAMINGFLKPINALISGWNATIGKVAGTIPEISVKIPKVPVPALATGAVIPPNREFLAVLGDQKQGMNIETPLATMIEAFKAALSEGGYGGDTTVILQVDGREFGRAIVKYGGQEEHRIGVKITA